MAEEKEIDIFQSELVPKHALLKDKEVSELLKEFDISLKQLPRIRATDPAVVKLNPKKGDIIKIVRKSPTSGESVYYRVVID